MHGNTYENDQQHSPGYVAFYSKMTRTKPQRQRTKSERINGKWEMNVRLFYGVANVYYGFVHVNTEQGISSTGWLLYYFLMTVTRMFMHKSNFNMLDNWSSSLLSSTVRSIYSFFLFLFLPLVLVISFSHFDYSNYCLAVGYCFSCFWLLVCFLFGTLAFFTFHPPSTECNIT